MTKFRRLRSAVRGRRLPAAGAFLFLGYLFANNLPPEARYSVRTGAESVRARSTQVRSSQSRSSWETVGHVSDNGGEVTVRIHEGDGLGLGWNSRLELWDVRAGQNRTPAHWNESGWAGLLAGGVWDDGTGLGEMPGHPAGREFLLDREAWAALRDRPLPSGIRFSPDGLHVSYRVRTGSSAEGTAVDDVRNGRRVATLPEPTEKLTVAPDGRTAVSLGPPAAEGAQRRLILWDLAAATRRAELVLPPAVEAGPVRSGRWHHVRYTSDGRYVFADSCSPALLRWWDAATGRQAGEVVTLAESGPGVLDGGVLVVHSRGDPVIDFWDVASGRKVDRWEPDLPAGLRVGYLSAPTGGRYLLAHLFPDTTPAARRSFPALDRAADWLADRLADRRSPRSHQLLVLDALDRRTLGQVPGVAGTVSPNGHWLATVDPDGVVRVWELPVGRPWVRGFGYAVAVFAGGWVVFGLPRRRRGLASGAA
jgi:WD40 repeat protein